MVLVNCWWFTPLPVHFADIWGNNIRGSTASIKILFQHDGILIQALISCVEKLNFRKTHGIATAFAVARATTSADPPSSAAPDASHQPNNHRTPSTSSRKRLAAQDPHHVVFYGSRTTGEPPCLPSQHRRTSGSVAAEKP
ncbi:hypothetical protein ACSQ67_020097 [Phaseolus vulgaris]